MLRTFYEDIRERATFKNAGIWGKGVKILVPFLASISLCVIGFVKAYSVMERSKAVVA